MEVTVKIEIKKRVRYLRAECGVRYWEGATVNGVKDEDGTLIPCREGDFWAPVIDLETGRIENWPQGTEADIHYKICDDGAYEVHDRDGALVKRITGYVIKMMCPEENGFGDYVIMKVGPEGLIKDFKVDLSEFESDG